MLGGNAFRGSPRRVLLGSRDDLGADPSPGHAKSAKSCLDLVWIWFFSGYILRQLWRCFFNDFFRTLFFSSRVIRMPPE